MTEEEVFAEKDSKGNVSIWSPFKEAVQELLIKRKAFEDMLMIADYSRASDRIMIVQNARNLVYKTGEIFPADAKGKLMNYVNTLSIRSDTLARLEQQRIANQYSVIKGQDQATKVELDTFKATANVFLNDFYVYLQKYGLDIKMKKNEDQIKRLYMSLQVKRRMFLNGFGIPISPEMEIFCRALNVRANEGYDNPIFIEGDTGVGKTTFAYAMITTYATNITGLGFNLDQDMVINEDREYVQMLFSKVQQNGVIWLDEVGNQAGKQTWWDQDQGNFMNYFTRVRVHGITTAAVWPDSKDIDPRMLKRGAVIVTINDKGFAQVRGFNKNRYARDKQYIPFAAKNKVALTGSEAADITSDFDMLNLLEIPYYKIPIEPWKKYSVRKEYSLKVGDLKKKYKQDRFSQADDIYLSFLLDIRTDQVMITAKDAKEVSEKVGYHLSFKRIADMIARGTGRRWKDIVKYENDIPNMDEYGYITIDQIMRTFLDRLRAMKQGSQQSNNEAF